MLAVHEFFPCTCTISAQPYESRSCASGCANTHAMSPFGTLAWQLVIKYGASLQDNAPMYTHEFAPAA